MAHGLFIDALKEKASIYSAGIETHGVNPRAIQVMKELNIDISHHTSNHMDEYKDISFDYLLTVCDHANESCPFFPNAIERLHENFPDPAKATGTEEEILTSFRHTRELIKEYVQNLVESIAKN